MNSSPINYPPVVSPEQWRRERLRLLAEEKESTRARDRLNTRRRELPMVRVEKDYRFEGPDGEVSLAGLFGGREQLIVYHFMWRWQDGQPLDEPCPGCSGWADQIARGHLATLRSRHTALVLVSRAPLARIVPFQRRMGWTIPWYSSAGSTFNYDFHASLDETVAPLEYNYRTPAEHERAGSAYFSDSQQPFDLHALSCFLRRGEEVFHTYSTYGRGTEAAGGAYYLLDLTALGRQENWELPKGRAADEGLPPRPDLAPYPDEYEQ